MMKMRLSALAFAALAIYGLGTIPGMAASPAGRYCGEMISDGDYRDVETILNVDKSGHINGTYEAGDSAGRLVGKLAEKDDGTGTSRSLIWTDKYGTGRLYLHFSDDYKQFNGRWGASKDGRFDAVSHSWTGAACGAN
ncbi:hypothetical protein GF108_09085 [Phyllobacterium sp. SYP-B3895]|uniref:hypothetical protein n=1 Tax=Phyllobacterium sp. SYP-B3895 TaxID=2663240 RepID=UPI0012996533|nr:hypothetical protein [Phyllobacterium sp. SYP-B3895]MRG55735.1 hypothetical protein [Phyllobacterium sp. SYP-B3895]